MGYKFLTMFKSGYSGKGPPQRTKPSSFFMKCYKFDYYLVDV